MQKFSLISIIFSSLALTSFISDDNPLNAQKKRAAVISIYCNKHILAPGFSEMNDAMSRLSKSATFNLSPTAMQLREKVFKEYASLMEYTFISEEIVLNKTQYAELKPSIIENPFYSNFVMPPGYIGIPADNRDAVMKTFTVFDSLDAVLIISMNYELIKYGIESIEFGSAKVRAFSEVRILDRNGKKIFKATAAEQSDKHLRIAKHGAINESELMPLIQEATDKTMVELSTIIKSKTKH